MNRYQKLNKVLANTNIRNINTYTKEKDFERLYHEWKKQNKKLSIKVIRRMIGLRKTN
nr:MAG TPA: hypothetical protein [Caudoviricetes sp.]